MLRHIIYLPIYNNKKKEKFYEEKKRKENENRLSLITNETTAKTVLYCTVCVRYVCVLQPHSDNNVFLFAYFSGKKQKNQKKTFIFAQI